MDFKKAGATTTGASTTAPTSTSAHPPPDIDEYLFSREMVRWAPYSLIVDGFRYSRLVLDKLNELGAAGGVGPGGQLQGLSVQPCFILSHFHSDHYTGLGPKWKFGPIFCTQATKTLCVQQLKVEPGIITALEVDTVYCIDLKLGQLVPLPGHLDPRSPDSLVSNDGLESELEDVDGSCELNRKVKVVLVDANHCPAATLILINAGTGKGGGLKVHTGDFRFNGGGHKKLPSSNGINPNQLKGVPMNTQRGGAGGRGSTSRALSSGSNLLGRSSYAKTPQQKQQQQQQQGNSRSTNTLQSQWTLPGGGDSGSDDASGRPTDPALAFLHKRVGDNHFLQAISDTSGGKTGVNTLFLDNTFCDPVYDFPPQHVIFDRLQAIVRRTAVDLAKGPPIRKTSSQPIRMLLMVGTYTIGKERVAISLADAFRPRRTGPPSSSSPPPVIFCSPSKKEILDPCFPPPTVPSALATPQEEDQQIHFKACATGDDLTWTRSSIDLGDTAEGLDSSSEVHVEVAVCLVGLGLLSYNGLGEALGLQRPSSDTTKKDGNKFSAVAASESERAAAASSVGSLDTASASNTDLSEAQQQLGAAGVPSHLTLWEGCTVALDDVDAVIGFEPTGWAGRKGKSNSITANSSTESSKEQPLSKQRHFMHKFWVHSVPYSEHCSFSELVQFVHYVSPKKVIPTVSTSQYEAQESIFLQYCQRLRPTTGSTTQPISRFFTTVKSKVTSFFGGGGAGAAVASSRAPTKTKQTQPKLEGATSTTPTTTGGRSSGSNTSSAAAGTTSRGKRGRSGETKSMNPSNRVLKVDEDGDDLCIVLKDDTPSPRRKSLATTTGTGGRVAAKRAEVVSLLDDREDDEVIIL